MVDVNQVEQQVAKDAQAVEQAAPGAFAKAKAAIAGSLSWTSAAYFGAGYFSYPFVKPLFGFAFGLAADLVKLISKL